MKDWLEQLVVNGIVAGAATKAVEKAIEREASLTRKAIVEAIGYGGGPVIEVTPIKRKAEPTPEKLPEPLWVWEPPSESSPEVKFRRLTAEALMNLPRELTEKEANLMRSIMLEEIGHSAKMNDRSVEDY